MPTIFDTKKDFPDQRNWCDRYTHLISTRKVRNIVTVSGKGARGHFPSRKASNLLKYESLVEEAVLRVLDVATRPKALATQPCVLELPGTPSLRYTPDIEIDFGNEKIFVEVKSDAFQKSRRDIARLREVFRRMRAEGTKLVLVLERDVRYQGLQEKLTCLLRDRPAPGRFRNDLDTSLWDPLHRQKPSADLLRRWREAQRECDALLERVMRRNPGDLLEEIR